MRRNFAAVSLFLLPILLSFPATAQFNSFEVAQNAPRVLPTKKTVNSGPEEISPEKGDTDPLNKMGKPKGNKTVLTGDQQVKEFVGVIQFLKGGAKWDGTERRDALGFKTLFGWNESIALADDAHLKIITRSRCVAVIYGESQLQTPLKSAESAWNVIGGSARWICGPGQTDTVRLNGHALSIGDGEILYHKNLLYVVHGKAVSESGELEAGQTYKWSGNRWAVEYNNEDLFRSWDLARNLPAPKESKILDKPQRKIRSRWYLGPMFGPASTSHPNSLFEINEPEIHGIRAAVNFMWRDHSVIASLNFYEIENNSAKDDCCMMGPPQEIPLALIATNLLLLTLVGVLTMTVIGPGPLESVLAWIFWKYEAFQTDRDLV